MFDNSVLVQTGEYLTMDYTYWYDKGNEECGPFFIGFLNEWPEHLTQGETLEELEEALKETYEFCKEFEEPRLKSKGVEERKKGTLRLKELVMP